MRPDEPEARHHQERRQYQIAEGPRLRAPAVHQPARERRHEGSGHRPFGEQVAHEIGDPERHVEGVHGRCFGGAEEPREHHLADDAQHPARHGGDADGARRARQTRAHVFSARSGTGSVTDA